MKLSFSIWVGLTFVTFSAVGQIRPLLKFENGRVYVTGLPSAISPYTTNISDEAWSTTLSVYTQNAYVKNIDQPIAGKCAWNGHAVVFQPAYPFVPGEAYYAVFATNAFLLNAGIKCESPADNAALSFTVPEKSFPITSVESIYPLSANLPENLLRMYIYFSAPMMPGEAYENIRLMRDDGTMVEKAFLVLDQELWDADRKRFTLLFDPGRIKRDLKSNIDLGTALCEGEKYQLMIDSTWRDIYGNGLQKSVQKNFAIAGAERARISPQYWKVIPPLAGSVGDIVILFDRPMDHSLAMKHITIKSPSGVVVGQAGTVNDTTWKFTPSVPWESGEFVITISPLLEDVAGNNLNNVFDLDLSKGSRVNSVEPVELPLTIGHPDR